jgi:hypothetical protein
MIVFRSDAGADVMMFDDVGTRMLETIGKEVGDRGVITVEQLPAAIATLRATADADKIRQQQVAEDDRPRTEVPPTGGPRPFVSFYQRAVPLIELFERAAKRDKPVFWGR